MGTPSLTPLPAGSDCLDLISGLQQFAPQQVALSHKLVALGDQCRGYGDVARACGADDGAFGIIGSAIGARHRGHGEMVNVKLAVPGRPSLSLTSTLTMYSPGGSSAWGMSMPLA